MSVPHSSATSVASPWRSTQIGSCFVAACPHAALGQGPLRSAALDHDVKRGRSFRTTPALPGGRRSAVMCIFRSCPSLVDVRSAHTAIAHTAHPSPGHISRAPVPEHAHTKAVALRVRSSRTNSTVARRTPTHMVTRSDFGHWRPIYTNSRLPAHALPARCPASPRSYNYDTGDDTVCRRRAAPRDLRISPRCASCRSGRRRAS